MEFLGLWSLGYNFSAFFSNPVTLQKIGMLFTLLGIYTAIKIYCIQNREKLNFAIIALEEEIKSNIKLIDAYIQHSDVGANLTEGTYELNVPERSAYDQFLGFACKHDLDLAKQIRSLYFQFFACKVIIEMNHAFIAYNLSSLYTSTLEDGKKLLQNGVITLNLSLANLSKKIKNDIKDNKIIVSLENLKSSKNNRYLL